MTNAGRETRTASIHALTRPSTARLFRLWVKKRGLTDSAAVEGLIVDALLREATATPVGLLARDLPPEVAARIEMLLTTQDTA